MSFRPAPACLCTGDVVGIRCPDGALAYGHSGPWVPDGASWRVEHDDLAFVVGIVSHPPDAGQCDGDGDAWDEALLLFGDCKLGWVETWQLRRL